MGDTQQPYVTIRARKPAGNGTRASSADSTYGSGSSDSFCPPATHDISRVSYHVKHLDTFAQTLQESASRSFPNRGRSSQRYQKVQSLLLHWKCDDLFVLPELEDLEKCLRDDYNFETDIFGIPSENSHLELMMKICAMIKEHESTNTLFVVYYGGHAKIDESRQSTWCATRHNDSPWLQWSAIQTLLERSVSDVLILLDCCAGAASATFPNGKSITETISASSWDAIAPHPGRYSFTNAVIEVLQDWRMRTFSAAMLHAEVLARLKHPRPVTINGKHFEARSTPVHFMMTSNHKAASIELCPIVPDSKRPPSPPQDASDLPDAALEGPSAGEPGPVSEPNEDEPHVMISLALEDDQRLDLSAWEQWLANFPALAKYVKVQGVFRSHSTLLLLSLPVHIWDLLPEDRACSFVAFIRSNNMIANKPEPTALPAAVAVPEAMENDQMVLETESVLTGTTYLPNEDASVIGGGNSRAPVRPTADYGAAARLGNPLAAQRMMAVHQIRQGGSLRTGPRTIASTTSLQTLQRQNTAPASLTGADEARNDETFTGSPVLNQVRSSRRTAFASGDDVPEGPPLAAHVITRLEQYYQRDPNPSVAVTEVYASNLGVETRDLDRWFHHRRLRDMTTYNLQNLKLDDSPPEAKEGVKLILPGHLSSLLDILLPKQALIVDLRSRSAFDRSHIYGAVNLRTPTLFLEHANFEMLERAFADDESRRTFGKWFQARCVIFYDRAVEFGWECPAAELLLEKFKKRGWPGQCFVLKGHYREFSSSFDKYVVGEKMTQEAKDFVDSLRERSRPSNETPSQTQQRYMDWLTVLETSDRVHTIELTPPQRQERLDALANHQQELEAEFEDQFPDLHKKVVGLRPVQPEPATEKQRLAAKDDAANFATKAALVEPLSRALEKMQEASSHAPAPAAPPSRQASGRYSGYQSEGASLVDKLGEVAATSVTLPPAALDDYYDETDPARDDQLRDDPRQGGRAPEAAAEARRGGGGGARERPFWKRLRSTK